MTIAHTIHLYYSRQDNCAHIFATVPIESKTSVSPSVIYSCSTCKNIHTFFNQASYLVSTPSQMKSFMAFAEKIGVTEYEIILD